MTLHQQLQKLETLCENKLESTTALKPESNFLDEDAQQILRTVAEYVGINYDDVEYTCDFIVTSNGNSFLALPYVFSNGSVPCIRWGNKVFQMDLTKALEEGVVDAQSHNDKFYTIDILYDESQNPFKFRVKLDPNKEMPPTIKFRKSLGKPELAEYLRVENTILNIRTITGQFRITEETSMTTKAGKEIPLLVLEDGTRVWKPSDFNAALPAKAYVDGGLHVTDADGNQQEFTLKAKSSLRKLNELEPGSYKVTDYQWRETSYGTMSIINVEGEGFMGNSKVSKTLQVLEPQISEDNPAILHVAGQTTMKNGNIKVDCRLEIPETQDPLASAINDLQAAPF